MPIRELQERRCLLSESPLLPVAGDTDIAPAPAGAVNGPADIDVVAERILVRKVAANEFAAGDDLFRAAGLRVARERSPANDRYADCREELRRRGDDLRRRLLVPGHRRPSTYRERQRHVRAVER